MVTPNGGLDAGLTSDFETIQGAAGRNLASGRDPYDMLPTSVRYRSAETSKGTSANDYDECCGC